MDATFIDSGKLRARYGCSAMWIERRLKGDPDFPRPIYFGTRRYWLIADIERWERKRAATSGPRPRGAAAKAAASV